MFELLVIDSNIKRVILNDYEKRKTILKIFYTNLHLKITLYIC